MTRSVSKSRRVARGSRASRAEATSESGSPKRSAWRGALPLAALVSPTPITSDGMRCSRASTRASSPWNRLSAPRSSITASSGPQSGRHSKRRRRRSFSVPRADSFAYTFQRDIVLDGSTLHANYACVVDRSVRRPLPLLWALHPQFAMRDGSRLELSGVGSSVLDTSDPASVRSVEWGGDLVVERDVAAGSDRMIYVTPGDGIAEARIVDVDGSTLRLYLGPRLCAVPRHMDGLWASHQWSRRGDRADQRILRRLGACPRFRLRRCVQPGRARDVVGEGRD